MAYPFSFISLCGVNVSLWSFIGLLRFGSEKIKLKKIKSRFSASKTELHSARRWLGEFFALLGWAKIYRALVKKIKKQTIKINFYQPRNLPTLENAPINEEEVAAVIPAHNEELTIAKTINSLKAIMPTERIYVASDGSTDRTVAIVRRLGAQAVDIQPSRGKAGAITYILKHFNLLDKYKAILIVDADSEVDKNYFKYALPFFRDPKTAAVAVHAQSKWQPHTWPRWSMFFAAYRVRLYRVIQTALRYGQTWKYTNVNFIIPGFSSIYRTSVLKRIEIDAPGLIIEDYNMTFEVRHKKLGLVAYSPRACSQSQDPVKLKDYIKQIKRWNLGFWQTVRRHGLWPSFFWAANGFFLAEIFLYGALMLALPLMIFAFYLSGGPLALPFTLPILHISRLTLLDLLVGIFLIDYFITVLVAIYEKKPLLLYYGFGFILLRYIDAFMFFYTLPLAFTTKSDGRWTSPKREAMA
jgi:cellulose synthase/poly-beta-1,6-N-acetylglucosamine synthase-like glycosyltransferase